MIENIIFDYLNLYGGILRDFDVYYETLEEWVIVLDKVDFFSSLDINMVDYATSMFFTLDYLSEYTLIKMNDDIIFDFILDDNNYIFFNNLWDYTSLLWIAHDILAPTYNYGNSLLLNIFYLIIGEFEAIDVSGPTWYTHDCNFLCTTGVVFMKNLVFMKKELMNWFDDIFLINFQMKFYYMFMDIKFYIFFNLKFFDIIINDLILLCNIFIYIFIFFLEILSYISILFDLKFIINICLNLCYYLKEFNEFFINFKYNVYLYQYKNMDMGFYMYLFFISSLNLFFIISLSKVFYQVILYYENQI